jgi:hypothetical protein
MNPQSCSRQLNRRATLLGAVVLLAVLAAFTARASAAVAVQLEYFFYNDGTLVVSGNGEPDDAVLNRVYNTPRPGIEWQLMTQHLTPGASYDIWLEGSNDGTPAGAFRWWLGRARATPRGALNVTGNVYVNAPRGPFEGQFTNPLAAACIVIRTTAGAPLQTAVFSAVTP